jgi:hypothetical protein
MSVGALYTSSAKPAYSESAHHRITLLHKPHLYDDTRMPNILITVWQAWCDFEGLVIYPLVHASFKATATVSQLDSAPAPNDSSALTG